MFVCIQISPLLSPNKPLLQRLCTSRKIGELSKAKAAQVNRGGTTQQQPTQHHTIHLKCTAASVCIDPHWQLSAKSKARHKEKLTEGLNEASEFAHVHRDHCGRGSHSRAQTNVSWHYVQVEPWHETKSRNATVFPESTRV